MSQNRRDFLKASAAVGSAFWVGNGELAFAESRATVEKINFACVGIEGKGSSDAQDANKHGNVVAICDIDERRLDKGAERYPDAKKFVDYREMYIEMADQIDAVTVSTSDHSHAPASVAAMKLGKHCFCQKPLTWSVKEAHVLRALAAEKGVATQMGNQGTANTGVREGVELVRAGKLGEIKSVHVWTNRPIWPQGDDRPAAEEEVPKGLHWDLFLGPAQARPYNSAYHPFKWRGWIDFGTGALGDMACHTANMVVWALDLFDPTSIVATSTGINAETYPKSSNITYQFPERKRGDGNGKWAAVPMHWYDGGNLPPQELVPGVKFKGSGSMIVGSEATLYSPDDYGAQYFIYKPGTSEEVKDFKKPEASIPRSPGHFTEFAIACSGGPAAMSNFDYAARLTGTILLGNVALRAGKEVKWDAEKMTTGDKETDKLLQREYREGWSL